jgi:HlyD family secretion protein
MKKIVLVLVVVAAAIGIATYSGIFSRQPAQAAGEGAAGAAVDGPRDGGGGGRAAGGRGGRAAGGRGGRGAAGPLTVEVATASRRQVAQQLVVVGNLIGDATVSVVPRAAGRLQDITVRLGDPVRRGQRIAKIEDFELQEQVKQQEAALEVASATIRQREADLQLAETNAERSRNLFARQLLPKQTLDDTEARYQAAIAQLDLARAQNTQSLARLEELRINLANTVIESPVNGFVSRRTVDPGAFVSQNAPVVEVVDIGRVRLVANVVERDLRQVQVGEGTRVEVDAFPGEMFMGRIARVSPVLDPATRTAPIEVEIPNPGFRLKPGMYARVAITTEERKEALVVPGNAVIDTGGRRGVFLLGEADVVSFRAVTVGIEAPEHIEILEGVAEGDRVVTTGAAALRDGERVLLSGDEGASRSAPAAAETEGNGPGRAGLRAGRGGRGANQ